MEQHQAMVTDGSKFFLSDTEVIYLCLFVTLPPLLLRHC